MAQTSPDSESPRSRLTFCPLQVAGDPPSEDLGANQAQLVKSEGGLQRLTASQLLYARQRWYDPQLGRWLSRDPIGFEGGWNLYNYVNNNPLTLTDASGLIEDSVSQEVLAAVADGNIEEVVFILDAEGPAVGSQSWTLLRNYRAASGWLYKKLGQKAAGDCYQVSLRVLDQLKGFGIQGKILRIQASGNYMYWRGVQIADNGFHQAVVVGNMVYDKLTGGGGMRYDLYMQLIREGSAGAQVVPFP